MPLRGSATIAPLPNPIKEDEEMQGGGPVLMGSRLPSASRLSSNTVLSLGSASERVNGWRRMLCCGKRRRRRRRENSKRHWSPFRIFVHRVVKSSRFSNFILGAIFLNSVLITLQNVESTMLAAMYWFDVFDKILMGIYIFELALKLYAQRERFLDSGWNTFDAFIVSISVVETAMYTVLNDSSSLSPSIFRLFRVFKALRAMRALRAISFLQNLQLIISTLFRSIPAMGSIILLLMLLLYIFAIIFVTLYQDLFPDRFDNLWTAMFSLFQLITLDDWSWYYMTVLEKDPDGAPQLMILMSLFIVLETFIVLNLMIAVIVNSLERANERKRHRKLRQQEQRAKSSGNVEDVSDLTSQDSGRKRKRKRKRKPSKRDRQRRRTSDPKGASSFKEGTSPRNASHRGSRKSSLAFAMGENKTAVNEEESQGSGSEDSGDEADMNRLKTPAPAFLKNGAIPYWQRELQPEVLALLASLDHNHHVLFEQQRLLDDLVDVTAPKQATN